jgi:predicted Zn-dependent protease
MTSFSSFDKTWARGGRWAVLTLPTDTLPAQAELRPWLKAASDLEETGRVAAAQRAYRSATQQWPAESLGWFALANSRHASGDSLGAEEALRQSLAQQPDFAAGWFNLSQVLVDRGCPQAGEQARACAQRLAPDDQRFAAGVKPATGGAAQQCSSPPVCPQAN